MSLELIDLPSELLCLLTSHLDPASAFAFSLASRSVHKTISPKIKGQLVNGFHFASTCAREGYLTLLQWAINEFGCDHADVDVLAEAIAHDHVAFADFIIHSHPKRFQSLQSLNPVPWSLASRRGRFAFLLAHPELIRPVDVLYARVSGDELLTQSLMSGLNTYGHSPEKSRGLSGTEDVRSDINALLRKTKGDLKLLESVFSREELPSELEATIYASRWREVNLETVLDALRAYPGLIRRGPNLEYTVSEVRILTWIARYGHLEIFRVLSELGTLSPREVLMRESDALEFFLEVVASGHADFLRELITAYGYTPQHDVEFREILATAIFGRWYNNSVAWRYHINDIDDWKLEEFSIDRRMATVDLTLSMSKVPEDFVEYLTSKIANPQVNQSQLRFLFWLTPRYLEFLRTRLGSLFLEKALESLLISQKNWHQYCPSGEVVSWIVREYPQLFENLNSMQFISLLSCYHVDLGLLEQIYLKSPNLQSDGGLSSFIEQLNLIITTPKVIEDDMFYSAHWGEIKKMREKGCIIPLRLQLYRWRQEAQRRARWFLRLSGFPLDPILINVIVFLNQDRQPILSIPKACGQHMITILPPKITTALLLRFGTRYTAHIVSLTGFTLAGVFVLTYSIGGLVLTYMILRFLVGILLSVLGK